MMTIIISATISFLISFGMMQLNLKMSQKALDEFFDKETKWFQQQLSWILDALKK